MPQMPVSKLNIAQQNYDYYAPETLAFGGIAKAKTLSTLPYSVKILLENLMRHLNKDFVDVEDIKNLANWSDENNSVIKVLPTGAIQHDDFTITDMSAEKICDLVTSRLEAALKTEIVSMNQSTLMPELKVRSKNTSGIQTALYNAVGVITVQEKVPSQPLAKYHPVEIQMKPVIGIKISGQSGLAEHKLAMAVAEQLEKDHLTGTIEFYGSGLKNINIHARACISALLIQQGADQAIFPIDEITLSAVKGSNKQKVRDYAQALGIWHDEKLPAPRVQRKIEINLAEL